MTAHEITFTGDYTSFAAALAAAGGDAYEADSVLERYRRRYREVSADPLGTARSSEARLLPYLAAIALALPVDGVCRVLDYGGGYGAAYHLCQAVLPDRRFHWTIVETPRVAAIGHELGAGDAKAFAHDLPPAGARFSLVIASGVLQCVADPAERFADLCRLDAAVMLVGRFPVVPWLERDRLTVQNVPPSLFAARFPAWFFAPAWRDRLARFGDTVVEFDAFSDSAILDGRLVQFRGALLQRS
jgi:putative methyltransferase (TIGR04325 family)